MLNKPALEPLRIEESGAPIGAVGDVVQMIEAVKMILPWHPNEGRFQLGSK